MIFGFAGKAGSGKDTAADYLVSNYGWDLKIGFASNLKEACACVFKLPVECFLTQEGKCAEFENPIIFSREHLVNIVGWMCKSHDVAINNINYEDFLGSILRTPRDILQFVGTEVMRSYTPSYHIDIIVKLSESKNIVVCDVRFPNEARAILDTGGILVKIDRVDGEAGYLTCDNKLHASETALDWWNHWSYELVNNGTCLTRFFASIDKMMILLEGGNR